MRTLGRNAATHRLEGRLLTIGDTWTVVAVGASRYYRQKAAERHGDLYEFRHRRHGDYWTVEARRR